ncbi:MAG TPA: ferritin-like domain-containing protein [Candidatus Thermoplasmatota archaeon]|nr:ferritin-like domain-containing protein [Candidatus Thermoplasmatota archaeon]
MATKDSTTQSGKMEKALERVPQETEAFLELLLNQALEAEGNFLALYEVAIRKAEAAEVKEKLEAFRDDHERHVQEIRGTLDQLGGALLLSALETTPFGEAVAQRLENVEGDEELLAEFLASEELSRSLYASLASTPAPEPVARIAQRGLADEERHYAWAAGKLGLPKA